MHISGAEPIAWAPSHSQWDVFPRGSSGVIAQACSMWNAAGWVNVHVPSGQSLSAALTLHSFVCCTRAWRQRHSSSARSAAKSSTGKLERKEGKTEREREQSYCVALVTCLSYCSTWMAENLVVFFIYKAVLNVLWKALPLTVGIILLWHNHVVGRMLNWDFLTLHWLWELIECQ